LLPVHLVEPPACGKPFEREEPSIDEDEFLDRTGEIHHNLRDQDLSTPCLARDPRGGIDRRAVEGPGLLHDLSGVQSCPHTNLPIRVLPVVFFEGSLDRNGAGDGLARRHEGDHESIAKKDDLTPSMLLELLPEHPLMPAQDFLGEVVALACAEFSRPLDVCKEDGEGSLKILVHGISLSENVARPSRPADSCPPHGNSSRAYRERLSLVPLAPSRGRTLAHRDRWRGP
jgi:hypothetical protein